MDLSIKELEKKLLKDPFNHELRLDYAVMLKDHAEWEESLNQFELLIKQELESALIYTGIALCLFHLGRKDEAVTKYTIARNYEDFEPQPALEEPTPKVRRDGPVLRIIEGKTGSADVIGLWSEDTENIGFKDIAGMDELKKILRLEIIEPFLRPGIFQRFKKKAGGGILLYGPPGCGKTMIAKAIATECNAYFMSVGISDVLNMGIGESERNLVDIFKNARAHKPSLLFFDELDALADSRSKSDSHHSRTVVNEFLAQLDGIHSQNDQVLILSTSNMPWDIDPVMKRPGRFSRQVFVPPPNAEAREKMLRLKLNGLPCRDISYTNLALITNNCSGADIDGIIDRAQEFALMDILDSGEKRNLEQEDLLKAMKGYNPSTIEWLKTVRNLGKYAGSDDSYRDVEKYLKSKNLL
jgi:SpoVK/Ycf46/Vps4 family AAA+-type ATPase